MASESGSGPQAGGASSETSTMGWLASAFKKPFESMGMTTAAEDTPSGGSKASADASKKKRFWKKSKAKKPGSVRKLREPSDDAPPNSSGGQSVAKDSARSSTPPSHFEDQAPRGVTKYSHSSPLDSSSNVFAADNGVGQDIVLPPDTTESSATGTNSHEPGPVASSEAGQASAGSDELGQEDEESKEPPAPSAEIEAAAAAAGVDAGPLSLSTSPSGNLYDASSKTRNRLNRFLELLEDENMAMDKLQKLAWSGISPQVRSVVWQLLLGYLPANRKRRQPTLFKRRQEYTSYLQEYYYVDENQRSEQEQALMHQIVIDVPRTCPSLPLFQVAALQKSLERILYIWAIRHPASGYVQGINDLATPLYVVFLTSVTGLEMSALPTVPTATLEKISPDVFSVIEADTFWCLSKLLDGIQDHYTFAQPGLQKMVFKLKELTNRIDSKLHDHLEDNNVQFLQFAFRWMNCLLLREISLPLVIRAWDTYLADPQQEGFKVYHVYVCAALLNKFAEQLKAMDFQELIVFLQNLPTEKWGEKDVESLLSQAFVYQSLFHDSPNHLR